MSESEEQTHDPWAGAERAAVGEFVVERRGAAVRVLHPQVRWPLLESVPGVPLVAAARGEARVHESRGFFRVDERRGAWDAAAGEPALRADGDGALLEGALAGGARFALRFEALDDARLRFALTVDDAGLNRARLTFRSDPEERFFGFGNQFTELELKGRVVPVLSQEPGIGRGVQPLTWCMETFFKAGGSWSHSNAPAPQCVTSRLRGLVLDVHAYSVFDLSAPDRVELSAHTSALVGELHGAADPLALLEAATATTGRMKALPDWIGRGAVLGFQGGRDAALAFLERVEAAGAPVAALWLQDWVGARTTSIGQQLWWNWEADPERYPDWPGFVAALRERGVQVLAYLNPFLVDPAAKGSFTRSFYAEAKERGYLVTDARGAPYAIQNTSFSAGLLDLTNPEARAWVEELIRTQLLDAGVRGWMADFGEALPFDAALHEGDAATFHNEYPEAWARLNRAACDAHPDGDEVVFFTRSGFLRSPGHTRLQWLGDQLTSWSREDGIHSAVVGLLSSGFSGYAFNHSDIGGYTATNIPWLPFRTPLVGHQRSRELLWRWIELNAFTAVFRTHEGNQPTRHAQIDHDAETLAQFARFARVFAALADYRRGLGEEAEARGLPLVRHLWLHFPDDPEVLGLEQQFLLGPDLLVAPVLAPGATRVRAYLPAGGWRHLWTGEAAGDPERGGWVRVAAPLGAPAVFHREGSAAGEALRETLAAQGDLVELPAPAVTPEPDAPLALGPAIASLLPKLGVGLAVVFVVAVLLRHFTGGPLQAAGTWLVAELGLAGLFVFTLGIDSVPTPLSYFPLLLLGIEGGLSPWTVLGVASGASILAGWLGYAVGRLVGMPPRIEAWLRRKHPQTPELLQRYGAWGIVLIGALPLPFALGTWSAGAMGVRARHAMLASLVRIPKTALYVLFIVLGITVGST